MTRLRILHVNDVASVGSILVRASRGRDRLYQPRLRRDLLPGRIGDLLLGAFRAADIAAIRRLWSREHFTHLHVHYGTFAHLAEAAGLDYSLHVHGGEVWIHPEGGIKGWLTRRSIERATRIVVSTPDLLEPTRALRSDAIYVPNPMEVPQVRTRDGGRSSPSILMLSKMDPNKGWDEQVLLMEELQRALPKMTFRFFTYGQLPDHERRSLEERLAAIGGEVLSFMPRTEFRSQLLTHYDFAIGQLFLGALGMSEMEAMAAALPVVANVRAHEAHGYHPVVIPPQSAVERIVRLWGEGFEARHANGLLGREYIRSVHDPKTSLRELEAALL